MNLFSRLQGGTKKPDALSYELSQELRVQIVQIWEKGFGPDERWHPGPGMAYEEINRILCEEHKMFSLPQVSPRQLPLRGTIAEYFLNLENVSKALDVVQVVFNTMEKMVGRTPLIYGDDAFGLSQFRPRYDDRRRSDDNRGWDRDSEIDAETNPGVYRGDSNSGQGQNCDNLFHNLTIGRTPRAGHRYNGITFL